MNPRVVRIVVIAAVCGAAAVGAEERMPTADAVLRELKAGNAHHVAKPVLAELSEHKTRSATGC